MILSKFSDSSRRLVYSATAVAGVAVALFYGASFRTADASTASVAAAPSATFAGTGFGAIPDAPVAGCGQTTGLTPLNITFNVSGLSGNVTTVDVNNITFGSPVHTWGNDITAVLIAPNGASHTLFGKVGATTATSCGDSSPLTGPYAFSDTAAAPPSGGWWQAATAATGTVPIATGLYRSTNSGGAGATNPMPATSINPSFTGVTNANGTWTLRMTDAGGGDTGAVTAATLSVTTVPTVAADANADFNGDGKTDFVVARGTATPLHDGLAAASVPVNNRVRSDLEVRMTPSERLAAKRAAAADPNAIAPPIYWYTSLNGPGTVGVAQLGDAATDFLVTEDFDGDLKDDLAVWTPGLAGSANFKVLQSSTNTVVVTTFGQDGDDPAVVGDYDGDGKADVATYRCPAFGGGAGQCFFFYRGSLANPSGNITYVPWGFGNDGDFFPNTGDFDGDGKNDFCIQRANPSSPANGQFVLGKSTGGVEYINWGTSSDFIVPGDYDGDGKSDFLVRRTVSGQRVNFLLTRTGATTQSNWGITGDASTPGDYDGDGKADLAIWRPSTDSSQNFFWVLNSSNAAVTQFEWGQCPAGACDFAVAGWAVH